ncbi:MAG: hypothetical protein JY451_00845 [Erythrobacter sp.]|nr:MAG: hypothetical protein JY451_00845 [Erythrobacter sp.]
MAWLNAEQHAIVSAAVREAELATSGEIVPVIADRSDGYSDVVLVWAVAASFTAMSVFALFPDFLLGKIDWLLGGWSIEHTYGEVIAWVLALGLLKFVAVWLLLSWDRLTFLFVPAPVKRQRVHDKAVRLFKVGAEGRTHGGTGVMLYLSMREHRAEIVADDSIALLVPAEVWGEAMADMLAEIRKGCVAEGIAAGVRDVGKVLAEHFPRRVDDTNELPDRLIEV